VVSLLLVVAPGRYGAILTAACVCSVIALLLSLRLRGGYVRTLEKSLLNRAVEIDPSLVEDSVTRSVLMRSVVTEHPISAPEIQPGEPQSEYHAPAADAFMGQVLELRSGDPNRVVRALERLRREDWALASLAIELLAWDPAMPAARDALKRMGSAIAGTLADALLDTDRDFTIRRRVPRVLAFVPSARSVEALFAALQDQRFEVRSIRAARCICS